MCHNVCFVSFFCGTLSKEVKEGESETPWPGSFGNEDPEKINPYES